MLSFSAVGCQKLNDRLYVWKKKALLKYSKPKNIFGIPALKDTRVTVINGFIHDLTLLIHDYETLIIVIYTLVMNLYLLLLSPRLPS
jgi:hypothetical protein